MLSPLFSFLLPFPISPCSKSAVFEHGTSIQHQKNAAPEKGIFRGRRELLQPAAKERQREDGEQYGKNSV
jgi:hypothetical protein